jgi:hypothetical protein
VFPFPLDLVYGVIDEEGDEATQHLETVTKTGCEVKHGNHAGHIDVSYHCPEWKTPAVKDHASADQGTEWLKQTGFEARHE